MHNQPPDSIPYAAHCIVRVWLHPQLHPHSILQVRDGEMRRNSTGWLTIRRRAVTATTAVAVPAIDSRLTRLAAVTFARGTDP